MLFLASCSQDYSVNNAPHRKTVSATVAGVVEQSHPVTVSKNIGAGSTIGGLGGALGGASVGSGTGRYASAVAGRFLGALAGSKAETQIRQKDAQEVMVKINGKSHKLISIGQDTFKPGDKVWAATNSFGEPLTITPR